jgi:hypothetical protein
MDCGDPFLRYADCHFGDHSYPGFRGGKPSAVCSVCGWVNRSYAGYIGFITRLANQRGVSWEQAERDWNRGAEEVA